jgi:hypothetical protein
VPEWRSAFCWNRHFIGAKTLIVPNVDYQCFMGLCPY